MLDAITLLHADQLCTRWRVPVLPRIIRRISLHLYGSVLHPDTQIGEGTTFGYGGLHVMIAKETRIGKRVFIAQGAWIGGRGGHPGAPVIEDDVTIGARALVLGPVRVGRGATVGANAVVIHDVPPYTTVGGVPARPLSVRRPRKTGTDSASAVGTNPE
jgi:serine O-acetyltransferase